MKLLYTLVFLFLIPSLSAQDISWQKVIPGYNNFNPTMNHACVANSPDGYWVSQLTRHRISYGQDFLGTTVAYHLNENGNMTDSVVFTGNSHMKLMKQHNDRLYMWVGYFDSMKVKNMSFSAPNNYRTFLCYYDQNGLHSLGEMGDTVAALNILNTGHLAMVTSGGFGSDLTLHVLTPMGGFHESKNLPQLGFVNSIEPLAAGGMFINGSCMGQNIKFDSIDISNGFVYTNYVLYLDAQFTGRWMRFIEDVTCIPSITKSNGTHTYWAGRTAIEPVFDTLNYTGGPTSSFEDFFLVKLVDGKYEWVREIPGDTIFAELTTGGQQTMGVDQQGNVYLLGTFRGYPVRWDAQTVSGKFSNSYNTLLISWDPSGKFRWVRDFGGPALEIALEMTVNGVDDLLFTSVLTDTFVFDGDTVRADYGDIWVVKIADRTSSVASLDNSPIPLSIYPNPSTGLLNHNRETETPFEITTYTGRTVFRGVLIPGKSVNIDHLVQGLYILKTADEAIRLIRQ